ncbi:MAG: ABC transporter ATP-binding protein [Acutalibacteraceae bacterium]|nr:ABC transporter ATP-binding protein [Acutalibacteraceae bacterium]
MGSENELTVLKGIDLQVKSGEFVALVGASGSGKSTLMNIIGTLDKPTEGKYLLDGENIHDFSDNKVSELRNQKIGFVFQNFNLISRMTALKNVELPMIYAGVSKKERQKRAMELLEMVGMENRIKHLPNELSGGQKQRVAIARAMVNNPSIILADEPTGALDSKSGKAVVDIFNDLNQNQKKTIIMVTHSQEVANIAQRIITISDGNIISDKGNEK